MPKPAPKTNYNKQNIFEDSSSSQSDKSQQPTSRELKKDYLYRVAKIQENCILKEKRQQEFEYGIKNSQQSFAMEDDDDQDEIYIDSIGGDFGISSKPQDNGQMAGKMEKKQEGPIYFLSDSGEDEDNNNTGKQNNQENHGISTKRIEQQNHESEKQVSKEKVWNFSDFEDDSDELPQNQGNEPEGGLEKTEEIEDGESSSQSSKQQIKGIKITSNPLQGNVSINIVNKKQFISSPIPPGIIIKCVLRRSSGFLSPYTEFDCFLHNGLKHFISAKRFPLAKTEVFRISTTPQIYDGEPYIGSLMTNTVHNNYWMLSQLSSKRSQNLGQLETFIEYDKIPKVGERSVKMFIPTETEKQLLEMSSRSASNQLLTQEHIVLINKSQSINEKSEQEQAQQKSRTIESTKTVFMIDNEDTDYHYIGLQKKSSDLFHITIQHPLTPLQGFAFVLTRFDVQLK